MKFKLGQKILDIVRGKRNVKEVFPAIANISYLIDEKKYKKYILSDFEDGLLRMRITNKCNAKCRYCGIQYWDEENQKLSMDSKVLYEYCKPLYEKAKILLLTGGDPLIAKESSKYCNFIGDNYPELTLYYETNGIAFSRTWQELSMKHLSIVHFSLNASNEEVYSKSCWDGDAGRAAYKKVHENLSSYMQLLRDNNLEVFAPDVSMVINKDNYFDIRDFVKYSLEMGLKFCMFYFDYTENDMSSNYFGCPETSRIALKELMKLERVLAKKFFIYFRLWIPLAEVELLQPEVDAIPIEELRREYADVLELAKNRSMKQEYELRQKIRKEHGKKTFTFEEDWTPTIHQTQVRNKNLCFAPFKEIDIYPNGTLECCGWITPRIQLKDWIKENQINWDELFNSSEMKEIRCKMLNDDFSLCQKCCPLNSEFNEICPPHKYGYDREEE